MAVEFVTIERFPFVPDAEAARDLLTDQGIPAFLSDEQTIQVNWLLGNAIGYIKLQVPSDQVEKARSVLREQQEFAAEAPRARARRLHRLPRLRYRDPANPARLPLVWLELRR